MLTTTERIPRQRAALATDLEQTSVRNADLTMLASAARSLAGHRADDPHAWRLTVEHLIAEASRVVAVRSRSLHSRLRRQPSSDPRALGHMLAARSDVEHALLSLFRRLHGDAHERRPVARLQDDAEAALVRYLELEHRWLSSIDTASRPFDVARRPALRTLHRRAPTRPHPHAPHRGVSGRIAFRVNGWLDHVKDTLDSRPVSRELRSATR